MVDIKTCGMRTAEAIDAALARGATHIGFIFFPRSPRHVSVEDAERLRAHVGDRARIVAVTVDADDAALREIVERVRPDMLQLHGSETPERVREVRERFALPVIRALALRERGDLERARGYDADIMLFDAKPPAGSDLPGGNGVSFDWTMLRDWDRPFWLSGGIDATNATAALRTGAAGLDLSSGLESAPGVKSTKRIDAFFDAIESVRAA